MFKTNSWADTFAFDVCIYKYKDKINRGFFLNKWINPKKQHKKNILPEDLELIKKEGEISNFNIHEIFYHNKHDLKAVRFIV